MIQSSLTTKSTSMRSLVVTQLTELFREKGFEGVSIGDVSQVTSLGRSSLYHHFPGGKTEMAQSVIDATSEALTTLIFEPLKGKEPLSVRIDQMLQSTAHIYDGGGLPCVLSSLMATATETAVGQSAGQLLQDWANAISQALAHASIDDAESRAAQALSFIQGGLVMSRALKSKAAYENAIKAARTVLLADAD